MMDTDNRPTDESPDLDDMGLDKEAVPESFSESDGEADRDHLVEDIASESPKKPRRKFGKFALGFTALSALVIGGASGGGFVKYVMPDSDNIAPTQTVDLSPLETQITQLKARNAKLETQLSDLSTAFDTLQTSVQDSVQNIEIPEVQVVDVSGLTSRLDVLENAPKPTPIDEAMLDRLEKLQADGSPALDLSAINARLAELEAENAKPAELSEAAQTRLETLTEQQAEATAKSKTQFSELSEGLQSVAFELSETQTGLAQLRDGQAAALETALKAAANSGVSSGVNNGANSGQISAVPFPKQALLDAISAQGQDKPFFKRALSKHIKVKDPSLPLGIVAAIETDLADGNSAAAAERFDKLPPEIRSAGQLWRDSLN